ncbi:MAG: hypothetical protein E2O57_02435 [Gammaproteobacteria bacterium]|nr:MAG: hypothetical protein E2O57_02435 [Gammaproteobacteria bacterium]
MSSYSNFMAFYVRFFLMGLLILWAPFLRADWMNLTGAETAQNIVEIYVLDEHVRVKLEVYIADLDKFEELVPDEWFKDSASKRPSLEQRMQTFASQRLQFITGEGVTLPAKLVLVEPRQRVDRQSAYAGMINPLTRRRVQDAPADKRVLYAEILYPFDGKPDQLKIIPPLDDQGYVTATIGFVAYHQAVPIIDFRFLGQAATLNLDWQDPWYSKFDNKNLSRHHKYPLMLYLYVEPRQVRLESLLRFTDIAELTDFSVDDSQLNLKDKRQLLQEHIKNYYSDKDTLEIDGIFFKPDSIRVQFLHATLTGLQVIDIETAMDESSLLVGISQQYLITELPQKIDSLWTFFNQRVNRIPVVVTDPVGPLMSLIDADDPEFGWQNFLKKYSDPVLHPVDVDTGWSITIPYLGETKIINWMPDEQEALKIVNAVLENVRVAFIEKDPARFSRVLGQVISSEQAKTLRKELAKLFSPRVSGGGSSSVQAFSDMQINGMRELGAPDGFSATISGSVSINAKHWGHIDARQFQFQLLLDLIEVEQQWRLADLTVIDIKVAR